MANLVEAYNKRRYNGFNIHIDPALNFGEFSMVVGGNSGSYPTLRGGGGGSGRGQASFTLDSAYISPEFLKLMRGD